MPREGKLISDINKASVASAFQIYNRLSVEHNIQTSRFESAHVLRFYKDLCILTDWGFDLQAWERLEKAEHERELALRTELIRQEKLEQLARRFDRKAAMRETWLSENQRLVAQVPDPHTHTL